MTTKLRRRLGFDVGAAGIAGGEFLRAEKMRERRMHGVVHPRELRQGLGALPSLFWKEVSVGERAIEEVANGDDLRERSSVDDEDRHLAVRIHRQVLGRLLLALVQLDELRLELGLGRLERDVRHERTRAGGEIELEHARSIGAQGLNEGLHYS